MSRASNLLIAELEKRWAMIRTNVPLFETMVQTQSLNAGEHLLFVADPTSTIGKNFLAHSGKPNPNNELMLGASHLSDAIEQFNPPLDSANRLYGEALQRGATHGGFLVACYAADGISLAEVVLGSRSMRLQANISSSWMNDFLDPANLMSVGAELAPHIPPGQTSTLDEINKAFLGHIESLIKADSIEAQPWLEWSVRPDTMDAVSFALSWAHNAFPQVIVQPELAASMMATQVFGEAVAGLELPWSTFMIRLPPRLLFGTTSDGDVVPLDNLIIQRRFENEGGFHLMAIASAQPLTLHHPGTAVADFATADAIGDESRRDLTMLPLDDLDERALLMAGRLFIGVLIEMNSDEQRRALEGERASSSPYNHRRSRQPKLWKFTLGRPVKLDVRQAVSEFVLSGRKGSSPTVQTLVQGHWKWQAYGEGLSLRKRIHIEPYWRGPEDAPIVVRPHEIND